MNQEPLQERRFSAPDVLVDAETADLEAAHRIQFVLHQSFRYRYSGPVSNVRQRLVVLPPLRHGPQNRTSHRLSVLGAEGTQAWTDDEFGNAIANISVPTVADEVTFRLEATIERSGRDPVLLPASVLADPRYRNGTTLTTPDAALTEAAHQVAGSLPPEPELAQRLGAFVHQALPYQKGRTAVGTTAAEAFAIGAGVCQDHAHVMLALCRALGVPARYVSGHMLGEGSTHAWVEVLVAAPHAEDRALALPFDPCHGRTPTANYITVATGRDYDDVAPTSGTYSGPFSNQLTANTRLDVAIIE